MNAFNFHLPRHFIHHSPVSLYRNKPKLIIAEQMTEGILVDARQLRKSSRTLTIKIWKNFYKSH